MGGANSEQMLAEAVSVALKRGLVRAKQHVVCVLSVRGDFMLKVVSVDDVGGGMAHSLSSSGKHPSPRLLFLICALFLPEARCACRPAAGKGGNKSLRLMDLPDLSKTRSIVGTVLSIYTAPGQPGVLLSCLYR